VWIGTLVAGGQPGTFEARVVLAAAGGGAGRATATITREGPQYVIELEGEGLPRPPVGAFYELWLVGAGDSPSQPNRASAGTFRPDGDGRVDVRLAAAVDPSRYAVLVVTRRRPALGTAPGPEVLTSEP
jgi:hypothetical protein